MKKLSDILYKVHLTGINGNTDIAVNNVVIDSRKINSSCLFIAIKGDKSDGHLFIEEAISKGALAVVCEILPRDL